MPHVIHQLSRQWQVDMMNVYTYPCTHTHHFNGHFSRWTTINWLSPWFSFSIYSWSNKCHAQIAQTPLIRFGVDLLYNTLYNKSTANPQHAWQIYNKSTTSAQLVVQQIHNKSYKCSLGYRRRVTDHILLSCGKTVRQCSVQHNTVTWLSSTFPHSGNTEAEACSYSPHVHEILYTLNLNPNVSHIVRVLQ